MPSRKLPKLKANAPQIPTTPAPVTTHTADKALPIPAALVNFDKLPDSAQVRLPVVVGLCNTSKATVWRHVRKGILPQPQSLGRGVTVWNVGALRRALNLAAGAS